MAVFVIGCSSLPFHRGSNEGKLQPFLGEPSIELQQVFKNQRFPNIVVAMDGTLVATWGSDGVVARRSEDGGKTWGPQITIAKPGFQGGGVTVDENSGDIIARSLLICAHPHKGRLCMLEDNVVGRRSSRSSGGLPTVTESPRKTTRSIPSMSW